MTAKVKANDSRQTAHRNTCKDTKEMPQSGSKVVPSHQTKSRRDEEQIITKQTPHMKPQTHRQRSTATEEPPWKVQ